MGVEQDVGREHPGLQLGVLADVARILYAALVAAHVVPGPTVEAVLFNAGDVVGNKVVAQLIPLVDRGPKRRRAGRPGQADRIAQTAGINAFAAAIGVAFQDIGAVIFIADAVLGHIGQ